MPSPLLAGVDTAYLRGIGKFEKEDIDTLKYTLLMKPDEKKEFNYIVREYKGTRASNR